MTGQFDAASDLRSHCVVAAYLSETCFAYRETKAAELKKYPKPEGPYNLRHLRKMCGESDIVIAAWGIHGKHLGQDERVLKELKNRRVPVYFF